MSEHPKQILLIDDDPAIHDIAEMLLSPNPRIGLTSCRTGAEALARIEEINPDLILLDMMMPGPDGLDVLYILKTNIRTRFIPVAFITGKAEPGDAQRYITMGAIGVIAKPLDLAEFPHQVDMLLAMAGKA